MGYFAEINNKNVVQRVIVIESSEYAHELLGGNWVETFPGDKNKNYASIGHIYVPKLKNFYSSIKDKRRILNMSNLKWTPAPNTYHNLFFGSKPKTIITEDNKIYHWDDNKEEWYEV